MKSIGEIAKIVQVPISTLRYYDEIGLIKPEHVDDENRYRYYSDDQVIQLLHIITLKKYGFSLDAIKALVQEESEDVIIQAYRSKIEELDYDIKQLNLSKDLLQKRIDQYLEGLKGVKPTVLIVDDSAFLRNIVKDIFTQNNYLVIGEARDGQEGVNLYKSHQPDVVIMDIGMPIKDGFEASQEIRAFDPEAKIVICSAKKEAGDIIKGLKAGASHYVAKPFMGDHLFKVVDDVCQKGIALDCGLMEEHLGRIMASNQEAETRMEDLIDRLQRGGEGEELAVLIQTQLKNK